MGALTNVASAVFIEPSIAEKLEVYWLGTTMDFETGVLKRNDFNPMMDQFALDYLLDAKVNLHIMPVNVASAMEIDFDEINAKIGNHFLGKFLMKRWMDHIDGARRKRVLWDLALITAFIKPELATTKKITTSRIAVIAPSLFMKPLMPMPFTLIFMKRFWLLKRSKVFLKPCKNALQA